MANTTTKADGGAQSDNNSNADSRVPISWVVVLVGVMILLLLVFSDGWMLGIVMLMVAVVVVMVIVAALSRHEKIANKRKI